MFDSWEDAVTKAEMMADREDSSYLSIIKKQKVRRPWKLGINQQPVKEPVE